MPHDLTPLSVYLEDSTPSEIALLLDEILYDLVQHIDPRGNHEDFIEKYFKVMMLRNQFAMMDENLSRVWK